MTSVDDLAANQAEAKDAGRTRAPKLVLPATPQPDDIAGLCGWLTVTFNLDRRHPIIGGAHEGIRGPEGHVALHRADAPALRFEPATRINTPLKLIESLNWRMLTTDGAIPAFKTDHCRQIGHVVRMLCGRTTTLSEADEAAGIVGTLMQSGEPVEGLTLYGTTAQRHEAGTALQRPLDEHTGRPTGAPRYLVDANTGELVIRVSDLAEAASRHTGSSLPRGWLDARMENLGWVRSCIDAHALPGRSGRTGPHTRMEVYRGLLPCAEEPSP